MRGPARRPAGLEDPDLPPGGRPVRGRGVRRQGDDRRQGVRPVPQPGDRGQQIKDAIPTGVPTGIGRPPGTSTSCRSRRPRTRATSRASSPSTPGPCRSRGPAGRGRGRRPATCSSTRGTSTPSPRRPSPATRSSTPRSRRPKPGSPRTRHDPVGLLDLAMLQHDDGRLEPAIESYRKTLANKPPEDVRGPRPARSCSRPSPSCCRTTSTPGRSCSASTRRSATVEVPADATEAQKKHAGRGGAAAEVELLLPGGQGEGERRASCSTRSTTT